MDIKKKNRVEQIAIDKAFVKGVNLIDIDSAIAGYMSDVIIPKLEENGNSIKVPLLYGNAERWAGARKQGYLRDGRGMIQIPLVMFKRNSIDRDSGMQHFREALTHFSYKSYSQKYKYDRFSVQNNTKQVKEVHSVVVPDYVTVTYEVMIWTSFTEHMNKIVEAFQYATDRYWGTEDGYKFRTRIDSFDNQQEVGEGSERVIRTTFTMITNAYLLPERYNEKPTVKKELTKKKVVFGLETDLTGPSGQLFNEPSLYNDYSQVIDFVAVRGSQMATFINSNSVKLVNVKKPILPSELVGVFDINNWFRIYINGDFISSSFYTYSYNGSSKEITFTFTGLGFDIEANDEVAITGKFEEV